MKKHCKNEEKYNQALQELLKDETLTLTYLSEKYHFSRGLFSKFLKENGINVKLRGKSTEYERRQKEALNIYLSTNKSIKIISKELKLDEKALGIYFNKQKIEIRNKPTNSGIEYSLNHDYFKVIDTDEKAYWLGFIMADGNVRNSNKSYQLNICLKGEDKEHIQKFLNAIESNHLIKIRTRNNKEYANMSLNSKQLVSDLIEKGCIPNKTYNGYLKDDVLITLNLKLSFLRGYIDGDGCISKKRNSIQIVVKNKVMADILMSIIKEAKISASIYNRDEIQDPFNYHNEKKAYSIYRISIHRKDDCKLLLNLLYKNASVYLDRKYNIYLLK